MKSSTCHSFLLAICLSFVFQAPAQDRVRYEGQPGSKVKIDGTSTIHDWTVESGIIRGFMEFDANYPLDPSKGELPPLKVLPKVQVEIPVRSIKSGKPSMDKVMHEAMKQPQYTNINYTLTEMSLKPGTRPAGSPILFDTKGELTVSGVTKPAAMVVAFDRVDTSRLKITGTNAVKITDFGIKPPAPTIGLGLIKTADDVRIVFEWIVAQKSAEKKTAEKAP